MVDPDKRGDLSSSARRREVALSVCAGLALTLALGCAARQTSTGPADLAINSPGPIAAVRTADSVRDETAFATVRPVGAIEAAPLPKVTLPTAVELCVRNNFHIRAAAQGVQVAEAELITSSLVPNASLLADAQLIPLRHADVNDQLGPPQYDALLGIPIDWLLFGKRVAAMEAARLGIDVSTADFTNVLRIQLAQTVDTFYEVLEAEEYLKLAQENHAELKAIAKATEDLEKAGKAGKPEPNQLRLAVLDAYLEIHARELALTGAKARLRPLIGRTAAGPDFEVAGTLEVKAVVPPPKLAEAVALAEAHRPDLKAAQAAVTQADATLELEHRRARPQVTIQPGWTYQDQRRVTGFRNGSLFDFGVSTTLPFTDRNQGNIHKAQAQLVGRQFAFQADRADALAEVETTLGEYEDAVEDITENNTPATLRAARDLRADMEAAYRRGDRRLVEILCAHRAYRDRVARVVEFEATYWRKLNKLNAVVGLKAFDPATRPTVSVGEPAEKK